MSDAVFWTLAVMDENDRSRAFVAGVYAFFLETEEITDRQREAFMKVFQRVSKAFDEGALDCQRHREDAAVLPFKPHVVDTCEVSK